MNTIELQVLIIWLLIYSNEASGNSRKNSKSTANNQVQNPYDGAQVFRVQPITDAQSDLIRNLEDRQQINIWKRKTNEGIVDVLVNSTMTNSVKKLLQNMHVPFEVLVDDVGIAINKENSLNQIKRTIGLGRAHNLTFEKYHRLNDIYGYLDYLAKTFPTICTVQVIGNSILGTPIKMLKIAGTPSPAKFSVFIEGGVHAREWISVASVVYVIKELVENRAQHASVTGIDVYVVPVVNPDGYEFSHTTDRMWRKNRRPLSTNNCVGVDLNRNFGYKWGGLGASTTKCNEAYRGETAFSEPESKAIRDCVSKINNIKAYLAFHSYGQYILYPWGYDKEYTSDRVALDTLGNKMAKNIEKATGSIYTVGNSAILLYPAAGGSDDWAKGGANIKYSYTIELRDEGSSGFMLSPTEIQTTGREAVVAFETVVEGILTNG